LPLPQLSIIRCPRASLTVCRRTPKSQSCAQRACVRVARWAATSHAQKRRRRQFAFLSFLPPCDARAHESPPHTASAHRHRTRCLRASPTRRITNAHHRRAPPSCIATAHHHRVSPSRVAIACRHRVSPSRVAIAHHPRSSHTLPTAHTETTPCRKANGAPSRAAVWRRSRFCFTRRRAKR